MTPISEWTDDELWDLTHPWNGPIYVAPLAAEVLRLRAQSAQLRTNMITLNEWVARAEKAEADLENYQATWGELTAEMREIKAENEKLRETLKAVYRELRLGHARMDETIGEMIHGPRTDVGFS